VPARFLDKNPIFITLDKTIRYLASKGVEKNKITEIKRKVNEIVTGFELSAAERTELKPDAKKLLSEIKKLKLKIGLFTINNRKVTEYILKKFGISDFFDVVIPRDRTIKIKPAEEHYLKVIEELNVKPTETIVIGDTIYDFIAPKKLGAVTIGVEGLFSREYLVKKVGVDYVVKHVGEAIKIIKQIINNQSKIINE